MANRSLHKTQYRSIITLFSIFIIVAIFFNVYFTYNSFIHEKEKIQINIMNTKKYIMKSQVDFFVTDIKNSRKKLLLKTKKELKKRVEMAHNIALNLYKNHKNDHAIKSIIFESLRELKFYDIGDQYVFMTKLDGTFLLLPGFKHLEGQNVFKLSSKSNKKTLKSITEMIKAKKEGYFEYQWQNHHTLKFNKKISYFKYFEPFNCYIGTGVFMSDIEEKLKKNFIEKIESFKFGQNIDNYIFAGTYKGISLTYPAKNKNVWNATDINGLKVVQEIIKTAKQGSGFVKYFIPLGTEKRLEKISYVVGLEKWNIYVGVGETFKEINKLIENKKDELLSALYMDISLILSLGILFLILFYYLHYKMKNLISRDIKYLLQSIKSLVEKNQEIELDKIHFNEFEQISKQTNQLLKNKIKIEHDLKEKELLFFQQSKMAAMGELLENIAHQWRQPLSLITVLSTGIQVKKQYGMLDDKFLDESLQNIDDNAEYLSRTIDDFRNFFVSKVKKEYFKMETVLEKTFKLLHLKIKERNIDIIKNIDNFEINSYKNQLLQVLLIIFNNAYDALQNIKDDKLIFVTISKNENSALISIKDNAGGIKSKNLDKIFEPYFTTKHKAHGTGIGLYMAQEILTKQIKGNIKVINEAYTFKEKEYTGANFIINIPLEEA